MMQIAADALEAPDVWVSAYSRLPGGSRALNPNDVGASAYLLIVKPELRLPEIQSAAHTFLRTNLTHEKLPQCMLSSCRDEAVLQPLKHLPNAWLTIIVLVVPKVLLPWVHLNVLCTHSLLGLSNAPNSEMTAVNTLRSRS
jgi:hypothetical protein